MSIVVQVQERRITLPLPNGDRTTASDVVHELTRGPHGEQLVGKQLKLIFSGRVIDQRELISAVVPIGAVVQCAVLSERTNIEDIEEGAITEERNADVSRRSGTSLSRRPHGRVDWADFVWGFMLGFVVGPLMCFWLLEPAPSMQKLGICLGCTCRTLSYEYRQMQVVFDPEEAVADSSEPQIRADNSFEVTMVTSDS